MAADGVHSFGHVLKHEVEVELVRLFSLERCRTWESEKGRRGKKRGEKIRLG
jgi:hypothetical protein